MRRFDAKDVAKLLAKLLAKKSFVSFYSPIDICPWCQMSAIANVHEPGIFVEIVPVEGFRVDRVSLIIDKLGSVEKVGDDLRAQTLTETRPLNPRDLITAADVEAHARIELWVTNASNEVRSLVAVAIVEDIPPKEKTK